MTVKLNPECECKLEGHIGPFFCEITCNEEEMTGIICTCKGFIRGSNKSHSCEVTYRYLGCEMKGVTLFFAPSNYCVQQERNTPDWSMPLRCEKILAKDFAGHACFCSEISNLNTSMAPGIDTSDHKTRLGGELEDAKRGKYSYTKPTEITNFTTSRLVNSTKQANRDLNDAHTYVTEGTFTVNTNIPKEKNAIKSMNSFIYTSICDLRILLRFTIHQRSH